METKQIKVNEIYTPKVPKAYSVNEILAAGGTTAFANKLGKSTENLIKRFEELPNEAFWTEEEVQEALATLNASK